MSGRLIYPMWIFLLNFIHMNPVTTGLIINLTSINFVTL